MLKFYLTKITPSSAASKTPDHHQRKPSLNSDKGLELPAIYNPLLGIYATTFPLHNLKFYITDEVQVIRAKYSICFKLF